MRLVELLVEADDSRHVVRGAIVGHERVPCWQPVAGEQRQEARRRVGLHVERLERLRAGAEQRLQRVHAPAHLEAAEPERLVLDYRAAEAATELMLRVRPAERRCPGVVAGGKLETR